MPLRGPINFSVLVPYPVLIRVQVQTRSITNFDGHKKIFQTQKIISDPGTCSRWSRASPRSSCDNYQVPRRWARSSRYRIRAGRFSTKKYVKLALKHSSFATHYLWKYLKFSCSMSLLFWPWALASMLGHNIILRAVRNVGEKVERCVILN